jgi:hypothetical protein
MSAEQWIKMAVDLAYAYHMNGALLCEGIFDGGALLVYSSPSVSRPWMRHVVKLYFDPANPHLSCDCAHGVRRLPCPHIGAGILLLRQMERGSLPENLRGQAEYEFWMDTLDAS